MKSIERLTEEEVLSSTYTSFVGALGYEERSKFVASQIWQNCTHRHVASFSDRHVFAFDQNLKWYKRKDFLIGDIEDFQFEEWWTSILHEAVTSATRGQARVCVDISSMNRFRIAILISTLLRSTIRKPIMVDFVYARAKYVDPPREIDPIVFSKPVIPFFAGWSNNLNASPTVIFGLGYDKEKAVGVTEYLEPGAIWAFVPTEQDARYERAIKRANKYFWDTIPADHLIRYDISKPYDCLVQLESLVYAVLKERRVVLVPFGPKIFTVCCCLVAGLHLPNVSVWRVSSGAFATPINRIADGSCTGISVRFDGR
ncbi:MAG: hypothetical protein IPL32_10875 [Chloracidobacterium sp.]|nr:hypothetical protein [Chloracidobacterium sp.]